MVGIGWTVPNIADDVSCFDINHQNSYIIYFILFVLAVIIFYNLIHTFLQGQIDRRFNSFSLISFGDSLQ